MGPATAFNDLREAAFDLARKHNATRLRLLREVSPACLESAFFHGDLTQIFVELANDLGTDARRLPRDGRKENME